MCRLFPWCSSFRACLGVHLVSLGISFEGRHNLCCIQWVHCIQDCTLDQPCADAAALQRFAQYNNPELFAPIQEACGDAALTSLTALVSADACPCVMVALGVWRPPPG